VSFLHLDLKRDYDSEKDDILRDFYIPVLSRAKKYFRLAGFFSSSTLAVAAKGMTTFAKNQGNMKLVVGARLQKRDVEAIREGLEEPEKVIAGMMLEELEQIEEEFVRDHVKALAWLVAKNQLSIRVAIVTDKYGQPIDYDTALRQGIFHQKVGVFEDEDGNLISFSGSVNESAAAWEDNIEEFKVFRSWVDAEKEYFDADLTKFNKFWEGNARRTRVVDIPEAIRKKLIEIAPSSLEELNLGKWTSGLRPRAFELRDYQRRAVEKWLGHEKKGIIEMATGTGKTLVALECMNRILTEERRIVVVITCPYNHLIVQWVREIDKAGIECEKLIADSSNPGWKDKLADNLVDISNGTLNNFIVLTTHTTFSSRDFMKLIGNVSQKRLLIVDEVHGIGAPERKEGLTGDYSYRLGLSATPSRWFDPEGTEKLYDYFEGVVFEFNLKDAIESGVLCHYDYQPHFTELTETEAADYEKITSKIAKTYFSSRNDRQREEIFSLLCFKRQNIIKDASNKLKVFRDMLDSLAELRYCLIYCTPKQIDLVQDILNEKSIVQHRFTEREGVTPEKKYEGLSERQFLLKEFAKGTYQALVSMKCLDEGVDVPPATTAIMMENSGNPREYIQRRGRILRNYPGKTKATIFDIIVIPSFSSNINSQVMELEKRIVAKELIRYKEFAGIADNRIECLRKIEWIENKYNIMA
jgi:superfamily II DNA or RNA helicase